MYKRDASELEIKISENASEEMRVFLNKVAEEIGGDPRQLILNILANTVATYIFIQAQPNPKKIAEYFGSILCEMIEMLSLEEKNGRK